MPAISSGGTVSSAVDISQFSSGALYLSGEFSGDTISFQGSNERSGTFAAIYNNGSAVSLTGSNRWHNIPASVFSFAFIKVVTNTAVLADADIPLILKT